MGKKRSMSAELAQTANGSTTAGGVMGGESPKANLSLALARDLCPHTLLNVANSIILWQFLFFCACQEGCECLTSLPGSGHSYVSAWWMWCLQTTVCQ